MKQFIRIGRRYYNTNQITNIDTNVDKWDHKTRANKPVIRITTTELFAECMGEDAAASSSATYDYDHDTPEAKAIMVWLETNEGSGDIEVIF